MAVMATGSMKSGVELEDDESALVNSATAKLLQTDSEELKVLHDNVLVWIHQYQMNSTQISSWIKARLAACDKPRPGTVLEYLKRAYMDWEM